LQKLEPSFNANLRHLNIILPFRKLFNTDTASKVLSNDNKLVFIRKLRPNTSQPAMTWHILPAPKEKKRTFIKDLDPGTKIAVRHTPLKEYLYEPVCQNEWQGRKSTKYPHNTKEHFMPTGRINPFHIVQA
jgi:hypothetical protein